MSNPPAIVLGEASLSQDGIAMVDGNTVLRRLPRDTIQTIEIRTGFLSAYPLPQLGIGIASLCVGLLSLRAFLVALTGAGPFRAMGLLTTLLPVGAWISLDALKRGEYLEVRGTGDSIRLSFKGVSQADLVSLVERARSELGYNIVDRRPGR